MEENTNEVESEEKPKKKMGVGKIILWVVVVLIVLVAAVQIVNADKYKATVLPIEGDKKVGVNPTDQALDFGDLSGDTSASRYVTLKSSGTRDTYVWILKFGSLSELIKTDQSAFVLKAGEEKKVEFSVYMPPSAVKNVRMDASVWIFKVPKVF
jgi:hypothetical protein